MKDLTIPTIVITNDNKINVVIANTQAQVTTTGNTYNQAGVSYNQIGVPYGGVYNAGQDVLAAVIALTFDQYGSTIPVPPSGEFSAGPGWFMLINGLTKGNGSGIIPPPIQAAEGMLIGVLGLTYSTGAPGGLYFILNEDLTYLLQENGSKLLL